MKPRLSSGAHTNRCAGATLAGKISSSPLLFEAMGEEQEASSLDSQKPLTRRRRCPACFKQYNRQDHFMEHVRVSGHSVHDPKCGVCGKYCKSFESLREHLTGPLSKASCSKIFDDRGCTLCMDVFDSPAALTVHEDSCRMSPATSMYNKVPSLGCGGELGLVDECNGNESGGVLALDCEMVGGGSDGNLDLCARVCLVDEDENLVFHSYVRAEIPVTDFRYDVAGIKEDHLKNALPLKEVRERIEEILQNGEALWKMRLKGGKSMILVGHNIKRDLESLQMYYPEHLQRDTANYRPLTKTNFASHSLKYLTKTYLGYEIQSDVHDPYEDCVAAMRLYRRLRDQAHKLAEVVIPRMMADGNKFDPVCGPNVVVSTVDALFMISRPSYKCWCLDLERDSDI